MQRQATPLLVLLMLAVSLAACRDRTQSTVAATSPPAKLELPGPPTQAAVPRAPALQRVRGNALMGKDGYGITLCGEPTQRIIGLSGQAKSMIEQFVAGGAREFFIDGWATTSTGAGADLQRIERVYTEGPGCADPPDDKLLIARGNEPFWNVAVGHDGLTLERPEQLALVVSGVSLGGSAGGRSLDAQTASGVLHLTVTPQPCSDGMSDALYGSTAKLTIGKQAYDGCAFAGGGASPD